MAIPNEKIPELLATSIEKRQKGYTDMISNENVLLYKLREEGNIVVEDFGPSIRERLLYNDTGTYTRYGGYEFLNVKPSDVFTEMEFSMKMAAVSVTISGEDMLKNSGSSRLEDLLSGKLDAADIELENNINIDVHSDGTADGGRQIGGLKLIVSTSPSAGTLGGIPRSWDFMQNKAFVATSSFPGDNSATSKANIIPRMNRIQSQMTKGTKGPNLWLMGLDYWLYYLEALQEKQTIMSDGSGLAAAGFNALKFYGGRKGSEIVLDGGVDTPMPAKKLYALDTKTMKLRVHKDRNFSKFGGVLRPTNQDAQTQHIGFAGNMTTNNPRANAVMVES